MGIQGLLPLLKAIHRPSHLCDWSGHTLAIDGYVLLHRAAYACTRQFAALPVLRQRILEYFLRDLDLFRQCGVSAYVVFDGDHLPAKRLTEKVRASRRAAALARATRLLADGDRESARDEFVKAIDITPEMAHDVILSLRQRKIKFVVAPYEADAQLRYLEMTGQVSGIITEDSDLLVYGAKNVLFKLDRSGNCVHICRDDFDLLEDKGMAQWTDGMFRQMAILSGCDYLARIPGLGIKRALKLIRRFTTAQRAIQAVRLEGKLSVPPNYEQLFRETEQTFLYQFVYDSTTRSLVPLHPYPRPPPASQALAGCGKKWKDEIAVGVAEGRLDPLTKEPFYSPQPGNSVRRSQTNSERLQDPSQSLSIQKNALFKKTDASGVSLQQLWSDLNPADAGKVAVFCETELETKLGMLKEKTEQMRRRKYVGLWHWDATRKMAVWWERKFVTSSNSKPSVSTGWTCKEKDVEKLSELMNLVAHQSERAFWFWFDNKWLFFYNSVKLLPFNLNRVQDRFQSLLVQKNAPVKKTDESGVSLQKLWSDLNPADAGKRPVFCGTGFQTTLGMLKERTDSMRRSKYVGLWHWDATRKMAVWWEREFVPSSNLRPSFSTGWTCKEKDVDKVSELMSSEVDELELGFWLWFHNKWLFFTRVQ